MSSLIDDRILRHVSGHEPAAFVLGTGRAHGLAFVRSLGRKGVPVVALNATAGPGRSSRHALDVTVQPQSGGEDVLELLLRVGERLARPAVLLPTSDQDTLLMARNREALQRSYRMKISSTDLLETIANKRTQYDLAREIGTPLPATWSPADREEVADLAERVDYPCIVKPVYNDLWRAYRAAQGFERWKKLAVAGSAAELLDAWDAMSRSGVELLVQEHIPGGDDQIFNLFTYSDSEARPIAALGRRKLRQWPIGHGSGCYLVSVREPRVIEQAFHLLERMGYVGLADVEFKRDARDGTFKLMETNIRCATHVSLAIDLGVDFPYIAYQDALDREVVPAMDYAEGRYWLDLGQDFGSFRTGGGLGWWAWMRSVARARSHAFWSLDDPAPVLARAVELVRDARRRLR